MKFFTASELKNTGTTALFSRGLQSYQHEYAVANEARSSQPQKSYDIFLSHSFLDRLTIYGLRQRLEKEGLSVYVDWIEDPVDRSSVTSANAELLRGRMRSCSALLYATSENASDSKWMPWELGYFDGFRQKVAVVPISDKESFQGREYIGVYPLMESDLWLWKDGKPLQRLQGWVRN